MLRSLTIRNIILIESLTLDFDAGLNALTGETGAGKSILLDSLGFALGRKGRADMVRPGADKGDVAAVFDLPAGHPAREILDAAGVAAEGEELILRRQATREGRSAAFVNDQRISSEVLAAVGETLVEIHGQHDDRGLLNPRGHRALLDLYAGAGAELDATRAAWRAAQAARAELDEARRALEEAARDAEFLRHSVKELTALAPQPGEADALDAERRLMQAAERIREDVARAAQALGLDGAEGAMSDAARWLDGVVDRAEGRLDEALGALERARTELGEAQRGVEEALEALSDDPARLEAVEERLFALRGLARKHRVQPDELSALAEDLAARLGKIDGGEGEIARLEEKAARAGAAYDAAAAALSARRKEAAERLDREVAAELAPLKLERAIFATAIEPQEAGPEGVDRVEFRIATNPGAEPGPIARIASGGELSRFLLAIKVRLAGRADGVSMIFDEIDRGVGGATADAVGRRLSKLAEEAQVLVVTHSPQVAARARHHWRIAKLAGEELAVTDVVRLAEGDRAEEIARMLAGETVTEAAREAARTLLAG